MSGSSIIWSVSALIHPECNLKKEVYVQKHQESEAVTCTKLIIVFDLCNNGFPISSYPGWPLGVAKIVNKLLELHTVSLLLIYLNF